MPDVLVRNVEPALIEYFKARARAHDRSLQNEILNLLTQERERELAERDALFARIDEFRDRLAASGRTFSDSGDLIREDRDSR